MTARQRRWASRATYVALAALRRLRVREFVEDDNGRPQRRLRTHRGDVALEIPLAGLVVVDCRLGALPELLCLRHTDSCA
jgi:hypothetical protein